MNWIYLMLAGAMEITWPVLLKQANGFTRLGPTAAMFGVGTLSFFFLSLALRTIPMGTAYAIWTGIGAAGAAILGMAFYHEPRTVARLVCLILIVAGIVGLKLVSPANTPTPPTYAPISRD